MNIVSPVVYLLVAYLCVVFQSTMKTSKTEFILQGIHKYFKFLFSSYDPLETLLAMISLLNNYVGPHCLNIWIAIAKGLRDYMDDVKELSLLRMESNSTSFLAICSLLLYPFSVCSCPQKNSASWLVDSYKSLMFHHRVSLTLNMFLKCGGQFIVLSKLHRMCTVLLQIVSLRICIQR